ncbi:helix-turn-helix domain-containing protein [Chryseobacterium rhizosphaerae]|jgi:AraC-like DNA-binding protein|uniref:AraC family transcriptional regulator n=1 Tax=Chryseobacterium rhizosphaerae TaxID=395937 RepID=A0ABX9IEG6_9FLAO|nr:helix-turn-helix domain-containing protein [Chryseobacterium rhizosphaerae]REC70938.1 AraC family transcriptional regulator [Chryseobacterium rhizosphaerae]GEN69874.1 hypothetical protein CRH01_44420 [Chryseobacterium rhizosphaerae]
MKIKYYLILFSLYSLVSAQSTIVDSLKEYSYSKLEQKFYNYARNDKAKQSALISKYYLKKAKSEKKEEQIAEGYIMQHFNENLPTALKYIDSLQAITKNSTENYYPARIYLLRGNLYSRFGNMKSALNNYILGLKYAKQKGNQRQIAFANIYIAYMNNYVGKHNESAKVLRYYLDNAQFFTETEYNNIHLNLADNYLEINKVDSAGAFIQKGLKSSLKTRDTARYYKYLVLNGYYNIKIENYKTAIHNLLICKKYFFATDDNIRDKNYTLLYLGKSYAGLLEKKKAIQCFVQIDSLVQKSSYIFPELREVYPYIIDYYKEKNDKEKQLYYVEKFLKVDPILDSQFRYISRELPRRYDTPRLIQEKEDIINELKNKKKFFYFSILVLSLIFIFLYSRSKKAEKKHKKIAQDLIHSVNNNTIKKEIPSIKEIHSDNIQEKEAIEDKTTKTISKDITQFILKELEIFEAKEQFLDKGISLGGLARKIKTNSKYLSEIINTHKGKNFATYLNDLRIDYAINRLAKDKKLRSYKISSIAEELGYNTEQAFTQAFKKRTGAPLSVYLKEIERL